MKKPLLQNEALLADVKEARQHRNGFHLWWLGQSGFLLQWQNQHLLLDPYLSDSLTAKYANTEKAHVRMTERVIAPERLDFIDVVTSSHNHTDHLDPDTLGPLFTVNPRMELVIPEANREAAASLVTRLVRGAQQSGAMTVRVGITTFPPVSESPETAVQRARVNAREESAS